MFSNGGTADEQFGRHRHRPRQQQQQQGASNAWSSPLPNSDDFDFEDELRHFANLERGYANRKNNSSSSNRNHHKHKRRAGFGGAAAEEDDLNGGTPQPLRTVKFDTMVRRQNTEQIRHALKRRKRSLMATEALADGGDAAHALVAAAEDDSSALTEDEARGAGDLIEVQGELAAARVYEDAMLFSTCSEDEEVLLKTLEMMRAQSCMMASCPDLDEKKKNNHLFEEDDEEAEERPKKKKKSKNDADYIPPEYHESVPDNTAGIFDDTHTQHSAGGTAASSKHEAAGSSDEDDDDNDLDNLLFTEGGAPHVREHEDSRRQRVHRLRLQVHEERKRRGNPPAECFLCMWGNSQYDAVNAPPMHALKQLLETEIGRRDLRAVARTAHKYFKEEIWKKMVHAGKKIPMWRTRDIYLHLLHHEREPNIFVYRYTGMLDKLAQTLINQVHVYDPNTRRIMVDRVVLNGFNNTVKLLQSFYNSNPRKMTFFDDKASFDLAAAASGQRHVGGGSGSGVPNLSSIGHYELKAIEAPHAVNVRNK